MARRVDVDPDRFNKIAALLDSPVEGERAAAFEAVRRTLHQVGLRVSDVVRPPPTGGWRFRARRLLDRHDGLTDWERKFLQGIVQWQGPKLSAKQLARLGEIEAAHG